MRHQKEEMQKIKEVRAEFFEKVLPHSTVSELWRELKEEYISDILSDNFEVLRENEQLGFLRWLLRTYRGEDLRKLFSLNEELGEKKLLYEEIHA